MACPKCGCKVHYEFDDEDGYDERMQRCAACGEVFDLDDAADDDDDERPESQPGATTFDGADAWNAYGA